MHKKGLCCILVQYQYHSAGCLQQARRTLYAATSNVQVYAMTSDFSMLTVGVVKCTSIHVQSHSCILDQIQQILHLQAKPADESFTLEHQHHTKAIPTTNYLSEIGNMITL